MSIQKRLRILFAVLQQEWHQKTCAECSATWWAAGKDRPELIAICDDCQAENIDRFLRRTEYEYQQHMKGVR